jgi:hypothetical protein
LIERSTVNEVVSPADFSDWANFGASASDYNELIRGKSGSLLTSNNARDFDRIQKGSGTFTSSRETATFYFDDDFQGSMRILIEDGGPITPIAAADMTRGDDFATLAGFGAGIEARADILAPEGFDGNGKRGIRLTLVYDPSATGSSGNDRFFKIFPDTSGNGESIYAYHAQLETTPNSTTPILGTRNSEEVRLFSGGQPDWFSPKEGTWLVEFTPRMKRLPQQSRLIAGGVGEQIVQIAGSDPFQLVTYDGNNDNRISNNIPPYERSKVAVSLRESSVRMASNGATTTGSHNGSLLNVDSLTIGRRDTFVGTLHSLRYFPEALSESTIQTLTQ